MPDVVIDIDVEIITLPVIGVSIVVPPQIDQPVNIVSPPVIGVSVVLPPQINLESVNQNQVGVNIATPMGQPGLPGTTNYPDLENIPTEFNPSAHAPTHSSDGTDPITIQIVQISDFPEQLPSDWNTIENKPLTFPPTLPINESDVTGLVSDLLVLTNDIVLSNEDIYALQIRATTDETNITTLQTNREADWAEITANQTAISNLETRATGDEAIMSLNATDIGNNASSIVALQTRATTDEATLAIHTTEIASSSGAITTLQIQLAGDEVTIENNTSSIVALQTRMTTDEVSIASLQSSRTTDEVNISSNTAAIAAIPVADNVTIKVVSGELVAQLPASVTWSSLSGIPSNVSNLTSELATINSNVSSGSGVVSSILVRLITDETNIASNTAAIAAIPPSTWTSITGKPSTFPPTLPIPYSSISGTPTLGTAAALNVAGSGNASSTQVVLGSDTRLLTVTPLWSALTGTPPALSIFSGTLPASSITGLPTTLAWSNLTGVPSTFPPTLPISYSNISGTPATLTWSTLSGIPSTFPPTLPIPESGVTNLISDLAARLQALSIGTVNTLSVGSSATATITGSAPTQTLNLGIPVGATGVGTAGARGSLITSGSGAPSSVAVTGDTYIDVVTGNLWIY